MKTLGLIMLVAFFCAFFGTLVSVGGFFKAGVVLFVSGTLTAWIVIACFLLTGDNA